MLRSVSSRYRDFKQRHAVGVWHSLNRLVIALIVFAAITGVICVFLPELKTLRLNSDRVEQLRAEIEQEKVLFASRTREARLLKNDPEYVETIARDQLEMMKEGETIFRLDSGPRR